MVLVGWSGIRRISARIIARMTNRHAVQQPQGWHGYRYGAAGHEGHEPKAHDQREQRERRTRCRKLPTIFAVRTYNAYSSPKSVRAHS